MPAALPHTYPETYLNPLSSYMFKYDTVHGEYTGDVEHDGDRLGYSVAGTGDVDGDGLDDLLMGAYYNNDGGTAAGKAYLMFGSDL